MRNLIISLCLLGAAVHAAPKLDVAVGTPTPALLTVLPDHENPNLYYFFPSSYRIAKRDGRVQFNYFEINSFWSVTGARAVMTMSAAVDEVALKNKLQEIKAQNPNAKFTPVAVIRSQIQQMGHVENPLLESVSCQPYGNLLGQDVGCEIGVKVKNRGLFIKMIRRNLTNVLSLTYTFMAVVNGTMQEFTHGLPIVFAEVGYGDYFFDGDGHPILDPLYEEYKALKVRKDDYFNRHLKAFAEDLQKLRVIKNKCAGLKTFAECRAKVSADGLAARVDELVRMSPSNPWKQLEDEIRNTEARFSDPEWLRINRRMVELINELKIGGAH